MPIFSFLFSVLVPLVFGACIGSFLNVIIYRLPMGRSIVWPGSHCSSCGKGLRWFHNIPILSWLALRGRAACCGCPIDGRYPVVEGLTAALTVVLWNLSPAPVAVVHLIFLYGLIVATFVDLDHFIIPDSISLGGCLYGMLASLAVPQVHETVSRWESVQGSGFGLLVGAGGLWLVSALGRLALRKDAMGLGDVKLMGAIGALLGWQGVLFTLIAASCIGSVAGLAVIIGRSRKAGVPIPFGPFLALGALLFLICGEDWLETYFRYTGISR